MKDIMKIDHVQRQATRFILSEHINGYKDRLVRLNMLPLIVLAGAAGCRIPDQVSTANIK